MDFSKLKDIQEIFLQNNHFGSRLEAAEMKFIELKLLILSDCKFHGVLPISIGNLSDQLRFLDLSRNQLHGNIPSSIGILFGLTFLHLGRTNRFKGQFPPTIGKLQKLQLFGLLGNQFSGPIQDEIGNLSLLTEPHIGSN